MIKKKLLYFLTIYLLLSPKCNLHVKMNFNCHLFTKLTSSPPQTKVKWFLRMKKNYNSKLESDQIIVATLFNLNNEILFTGNKEPELSPVTLRLLSPITISPLLFGRPLIIFFLLYALATGFSCNIRTKAEWMKRHFWFIQFGDWFGRVHWERKQASETG